MQGDGGPCGLEGSCFRAEGFSAWPFETRVLVVEADGIAGPTERSVASGAGTADVKQDLGKRRDKSKVGVLIVRNRKESV
jgi:hypothetical protein